jgi:hypothetical protein
VPGRAGTPCGPRAVPGGPPGRPGAAQQRVPGAATSRTQSPCRARGNGRPAPRRPVPARRCRGGRRRARTGTPARMPGRPESSKVTAVAARSPLIRWPPQLAASQISTATKITTNNTTTMTAAGMVRSLWSCLCTSVPLAVDGARPWRGRQARSRRAGGLSCPGSACRCRTYACSIRCRAPSALGTRPREYRPPGLPHRGEAGRARPARPAAPLASRSRPPGAVACHPGSSRHGQPLPPGPRAVPGAPSSPPAPADDADGEPGPAVTWFWHARPTAPLPQPKPAGRPASLSPIPRSFRPAASPRAAADGSRRRRLT